MNRIIVFANQKGGVGKTTLCTLFANYLAEIKQPVLVIDCDGQQTIFEKRQADIKKYGDDNFTYSIKPFPICEAEKMEHLMKSLKTINAIVLIDSPGHLAQQGLIPLFRYADEIVCPYQFEATSVNSTVTFVSFIKKLQMAYKDMHNRIYLIPNKYDSRVGKKEELELWDETEKAFSRFGHNLPKIKLKQDLQRYNTIAMNDKVKQEVLPAFNDLFNNINK